MCCAYAGSTLLYPELEELPQNDCDFQSLWLLLFLLGNVLWKHSRSKVKLSGIQSFRLFVPQKDADVSGAGCIQKTSGKKDACVAEVRSYIIVYYYNVLHVP